MNANPTFWEHPLPIQVLILRLKDGEQVIESENTKHEIRREGANITSRLTITNVNQQR